MAQPGRGSTKVVLALYQDTQGTTALILDTAGRLLGRSYAMVTQHLPQPGWVEYDPYEIWHRSWQAVEQVCRAAGVAREELAALGVATQQGTVLCWERETGRPIGPAISRRCQRSADICAELRAGGYEETIRQRAGGRLDTTAAGPKLSWLLANIPGLRRRARNGQICCGTVDSWLLWNLTGGAVHATDQTNASDTLLYNLRLGDWDDELLELFGVPRAMLPQVRPAGSLYGRSGSTPITALCADQQAALFGQGGFTPGIAKVTYGRDAMVMMEAGNEPIDTAGELYTAAAAALEGEPVRFVLSGRVLAAGSMVEWLRDEATLIPTVADSEMLAQQSSGATGLYVIPALSGLGAPYWVPEARGMIVGLGPGTNRAGLVRATLEGIAYRVRDIVEALLRWSRQPIRELRADGGAAANNFLLQFQADILGVPVRRSRLTSAVAAGVGFLAGLQAGVWSSRAEVDALRSEDRCFEPVLEAHARQSLYQGWQEAVRKLLTKGEGR